MGASAATAVSAMLRSVRVLCLLALAAGTTACADLHYYGQSIGGHLDVMMRQAAIPELLEQSGTPEKLRHQLREALDIRDFASQQLALPKNSSYRSYADIERPYVVWSVVATPELSLRPRSWCFPFAGCVNYRGYFSRSGAERFGASLRDEGLDVHIAGVCAYSTLGWLADPVLNTMLGSRPELLAGTIFHELAHQLIYVQDDSDFNEAFATTVAREGLRRWLRSQGDGAALEDFETRLRGQAAFVNLVMTTRAELRALYQRTVSDEIKRVEKARILSTFRSRFERKKGGLKALAAYTPWFAGEINNARLAAVATYHQQVPAFERLLHHGGSDLSTFYRAVERLARLMREERRQALDLP